MPTYVDDENGPVTEECLYYCAPGAPAWCFGQDCTCQCHREGEDAAKVHLGEPAEQSP